MTERTLKQWQHAMQAHVDFPAPISNFALTIRSQYQPFILADMPWAIQPIRSKKLLLQIRDKYIAKIIDIAKQTQLNFLVRPYIDCSHLVGTSDLGTGI
jgi:hypothetical protein